MNRSFFCPAFFACPERYFRLHCPCGSGAKVEGKGAFVALFPKRSHHRDTAEGRPEGNPGGGVSSLTATDKPLDSCGGASKMTNFTGIGSGALNFEFAAVRDAPIGGYCVTPLV